MLMEENTSDPVVAKKENPLRAEKHRKLNEIKELGYNPFPHNYPRTHQNNEIREKHESAIEAGDKLKEEVVTIAGRLMTKRDMGKASFFNIQDQSGSMQVYLKITEIENAEIFKLVDIGDIVGVKGFCF